MIRFPTPRGVKGRGVALLAALLMVVSGCAESAPPRPPPTQAEWTVARERLAALRQTVPRAPYVQEVSISLREPGTGKIFDGRGAIAVDPGHAMRMILIGPGGATALDAWVTKDRYRFAVPPLQLLRRGGTEAPPGLPIGFFRWWFLGPFDGKLKTALGSTLVLDDGNAIVALDADESDGARTIVARRRHGSTIEWLGYEGHGGVGDRATYRDLASGLRVNVTVDKLGEAPPEPEVFRDPDEVAP